MLLRGDGSWSGSEASSWEDYPTRTTQRVSPHRGRTRQCRYHSDYHLDYTVWKMWNSMRCQILNLWHTFRFSCSKDFCCLLNFFLPKTSTAMLRGRARIHAGNSTTWGWRMLHVLIGNTWRHRTAQGTPGRNHPYKKSSICAIDNGSVIVCFSVFLCCSPKQRGWWQDSKPANNMRRRKPLMWSKGIQARKG